MTAPLLEVENLSVSFRQGGARRTVVDQVAFQMSAGRALALVGETGSGKTITALALLRLLPAPARVDSGSVHFEGQNLLALSDREFHRYRGRRLAIAFQEPEAALDPYAKVGELVTRPLRMYSELSAREARRQAATVLSQLGISNPTEVLSEYAHQLPEGHRQRILLAMALCCDPKLLVLDEPTTALDTTSQAQVIERLEQVKREAKLAMLLITHDLGLVAETSEDLVVMYAGQVVEQGPVGEVLRDSAHPYTRGLLASIPPMHVTGPPHTRRLPTIQGGASFDPASHGCRFAPRCAYRETKPNGWQRCDEEQPALFRLSHTRSSRCHFAEALV